MSENLRLRHQPELRADRKVQAIPQGYNGPAQVREKKAKGFMSIWCTRNRASERAPAKARVVGAALCPSLASVVAILMVLGPATVFARPGLAEQKDYGGAEIREKGQRDQQMEADFLERFLRLPPQERVRLWKKGPDISGAGVTQRHIEQALVAVGTDAAPYLAEIVKNGNSYQQASALSLLCDMDRFVRLEDMPISGIPESMYVKPLGVRGRVSEFIAVDGRRIGKDAYEAVKLAADQTRNYDLRIFARFCSGMLAQDLRKLSLAEVLKEWRQAVIKSKGVLKSSYNEYNVSFILKGILVERAPDSIPGLVALLDGETNAYVREALVELIEVVDIYRMRLRATEVGRSAIEAVHRAAKVGNFKPAFTNREYIQEALDNFDDFVFRDKLPIFDLEWAKALKQLATVELKGTDNSYAYARFSEPEVLRYIAYLTQVDPYFPSWEFTFVGPDRDAVMHPRFVAKILKYGEYWKRFKAETNISR